MSCNLTLLDRLTNPNIFSTWKVNTTNAINAIISENPANNVTLQGLETDITNTLSCAQQRLSELSNAPSTITRLESELVSARATLSSVQNDAYIAKERTKLITNPEQHVTVYEGWFPLFRPLQITSMLLLVGFALLFTTLALGSLTHLMGFRVQLGYELPYFIRPGGTSGIFTPLTLGIGSLFIILIAVIIYAFTRK